MPFRATAAHLEMKTHNYNAHHSPIGAFASFTLGFRGAQGGLGLELGGPANQNVFIGLENASNAFDLLPFYDETAGFIATESSRRELKCRAENRRFQRFSTLYP